MTDPQHPHDDSTAAGTHAAPAKQHGDPLLAASAGATEGTEGTRHGHDAAADSRDDD